MTQTPTSPTVKTKSSAWDESVTPAQVRWRRMHPISPLLEMWKFFSALVALIFLHNAETFPDVYRHFSAHGVKISNREMLEFLLGIVGVFLLIALIVFLLWRAKTWAVDRDGVYLRAGILDRKVRVVRLPRIQTVDIVHPLLGRIFGLGKLNVEVAGAQDSRLVIGYLRTRELQALREQILQLAAGIQAPAASAIQENPVAGAAPTAAASPQATGSAPAAPLPQRQMRRGDAYPLYTVDAATLLGGLLRSGIFIWALIYLLALLVFIGFALAQAVNADAGIGKFVDYLSAGAGFLIFFLSFISAGWARLDGNWGFSAFATPAGIRIDTGLTAHTSATVPPGRVHAVGFEQSPLWRAKNWWTVKVALAGSFSVDMSASGDVKIKTKNVLLPVGKADAALRALWLVAPDLGTPDPDALLEAALCGSDQAGVGDPHLSVAQPERGFIRIAARARIFSPLGWRREAIALTDTCVILRLGRWWKKVSVIPYERIQSLCVKQGPWARSKNVAKIQFCLIPQNPVKAELSNLDFADAANIAWLVSARAALRRSQEHLDRWLERATSNPQFTCPPQTPVGS